MYLQTHQVLYKHSYETPYVNGDPVRYGECSTLVTNCAHANTRKSAHRYSGSVELQAGVHDNTDLLLKE